MKPIILQRLLIWLGVGFLATPVLPQWAQWGGPERNFRIATEGLSASWPENGLATAWIRESKKMRALRVRHNSGP